MSIRIMTHVWEHSHAKGSNLLILLAIADHADDQGRAYPSVQRLMVKGRMSERNVQYCLKDLEAMSELKIHRNAGPHGTHLYEISIDGAKSAPVQSLRGAKSARKGRKVCAGGVQPVAPESSVEPSLEPSVKREARARENSATECPETIEPTPHHKAFAAGHQLQISDELDHFLSHHRSKGSVFKDWPAAFTTWLHKAVQFQGTPGNGRARDAPAPDPPSKDVCVGYPRRGEPPRACWKCGFSHFASGG